jgi:hypothetical protein
MPRRRVQRSWRGYLARRDIAGELYVAVLSADGLPSSMLKKVNPFVVVELLDQDGQVCQRVLASFVAPLARLLPHPPTRSPICSLTFA